MMGHVQVAQEPIESAPNGQSLEQFEQQNKVVLNCSPEYKINMLETTLI